jgi:hypothetical protein
LDGKSKEVQEGKKDHKEKNCPQEAGSKEAARKNPRRRAGRTYFCSSLKSCLARFLTT